MPRDRLAKSTLKPLYLTERTWLNRQTKREKNTKVLLVEAGKYVICDLRNM